MNLLVIGGAQFFVVFRATADFRGLTIRQAAISLLAEHHHRIATEYLAALASCYPVEMGTAWSGRTVRRAQRHLLALAGDVDTRLVEKASRRSQANEPARRRSWREGAAGHAVELQPSTSAGHG